MTRATLELVQHRTAIADGLELIRKRYPAGLRMGRHEHADWRFCLALRGSYTDSWRGSHRTRTPWQLSLHPAGEAHTSVFHASTACFHIAYTGAWEERLLGAFGIAREPQEFLGGRVPLVAAQLHDELRRDDTASPLVLEGLAFELIGWAARALGHERPDAPWLRQARDLLHDRFAESLRVSEVAATLGVHPVQLAREFRRAFGCTVGDYVRRLRVDFVCRELATSASLAELALRAGFADQSHLTRVFKRATGVTPREYRKRGG